jgi:hypothetical protein
MGREVSIRVAGRQGTGQRGAAARRSVRRRDGRGGTASGAAGGAAWYLERGREAIRVRHDDADEDPGLELQRRADRVTSLILFSDYPDVDIEIEIINLRRWCAERWPDRLELFEMLYVSRFRRLREQFPRDR